jgi:hypothetical protein
MTGIRHGRRTFIYPIGKSDRLPRKRWNKSLGRDLFAQSLIRIWRKRRRRKKRRRISRIRRKKRSVPFFKVMVATRVLKTQ